MPCVMTQKGDVTLNGDYLQAAYGQKALGISGFFTYVGLGLGFLGSSLALPFGLYVLICQRTQEKFVQVCPLCRRS